MRLKLSEMLACAVMIAGFPTLGKTAPPRVVKKTSANPVSSAKSFSRRTPAKGSLKARALVSGPLRQTAPSPDRIKEIQDALVSKGYMTTPGTGVWDQESTDAMKHFQSDQKLDITGKVSARTLISLGLGPKDESLPSNPASSNPASSNPIPSK